ncbi:MAG: hypothetical protein RKP20_06590 [Candidatus Competibacter sp.]|nr:hypothetical protein [Candidatus Competibacter sp.]
MTSNDDTGNPARWLSALERGLTFAERGRLGKLPDKADTGQWAAMLKATGYGSGAWWTHKITRAIRQRDLNARNNVIARADLLAWLEQYDAVPNAWRKPSVPAPQCAVPVPGVTDPAEPAPVPQGEPDRTEQGAAAKRAALAQLLDELDKRAADNGAGFNRHSLPGTKEEFALLLKSHCPVFRYMVTVTVADYLKGKCKFQRGAQSEQGKGKAVWALFPEYDLK